MRRFIPFLTLLLSAPALPAEPPIPSVFNHGFVNASNDVHTDYHVFSVFPVLCFGPTVAEAYRRLNVIPGTEAALHEASVQYRKIALAAVLRSLEEQGFSYASMPERMKEEYDAVLQNSALVMVTGPQLTDRTPIYGVASISFDWGEGTAGERRLGIRVPRAVPEARFLDFHVRDGRGRIVIDEALSLLFSSRLWFLGGNLNTAELKTFELSQDRADWEEQAKRLNIPAGEVRAQVLAIIQHVISSFMLTGKDVLAPAAQKLIPPEALLEKRLQELAPRLERASSGFADRRATLEKAMREFALNPPPQEFSLIENVFAYVGGIDAKTGRDLIGAKERIFRRRFPFSNKLDGFPDPDVPGMTLSVLQASRSEFDSGAFLKHYSPRPVEDYPTGRHYVAPIAGELIYGPEDIFGVIPPRLSQTFDCDRYLVEYMHTFGRR